MKMNLCKLLALLCVAAAYFNAAAVRAQYDYYGDFDWRRYSYNPTLHPGSPNIPSGNYCTPIKGQGGGTCAAFSSVAVLESKTRISQGNPDLAIDLSEQALLSAGLVDATYGGWPTSCLDYFSSTGVVSEAELGFTASNSAAPGEWPLGGGWQNRAYKTAGYTSIQNTLQTVKRALWQYGPLETDVSSLDIYGRPYLIDPSAPTHGINHAVVIVGYKDDSSIPSGGYFIVKNSWGASAGEGGYCFVSYQDILAQDTVLACTGVATGPERYWSGSGVWNNAQNWRTIHNGAYNNATWRDYSNAMFEGTPGTVNVATNATAYMLNFASGGYTLNGAGAITLAGRGAGIDAPVNGDVTINNPLTLSLCPQEQDNPGFAAYPINIHKTGSGTLTLAGDISNNATRGLLVNGSGNVLVSGDISGTTAVTVAMSDNGTLALSGANTYTGATTVSGGVLALQRANAPSLPRGSEIVVNPGGTIRVDRTNALGLSNDEMPSRFTLQYGGAMTTADNVSARLGDITLYQGGTLASGTPNSTSGSWSTQGTVTVAGTTGSTISAADVSLGADTTFNVAWNSRLDVTGTINRGAGALIKAGGGPMHLWHANAYTGPTIVNGGVLELDNYGSSTLAQDSPIMVNNGGELRVGSVNALGMGVGSNYIPSSITVKAGGCLSTADGVVANVSNLHLDGGNLVSGTPHPSAGSWTLQNHLWVAAGTAPTISATDVWLYKADGADGVTFDVGANATLNVTGTIVRGNGALIKTGAGTMVLSNANTYTTPTTIAAGIVKIAGSGSINSTSGITLDGGTLLQDSSTPLDRTIAFLSGTFGGTGTYAGNLSPGNCHLAPGDVGIGTLTDLGNLDLTGGSILDFDFGSTVGISDLIALSGSLVLDGTMNIDCGGELADGSYTIFSGAENVTDNGLRFGAVPGGHRCSYRIDGGNVIVTVGVPEPSSLLLLLAAATCAAVYARHRQRG